ncbi:hypothetical protein QTP88_029443 [Uroleucon formosanum]
MSCLQPLNSFSLNYHPSPLIIRIKSILFSLGQLDFNMQFLWVPSHVGFRGNEYANSLAKSSSNFISPSFSPIPWSDFTPLLRHHIFNLWSAYWLVIIFVSMGKPTTPNNTTTTSKKVTTRSTSSIPPSNSDIMVALDKLRGEVLSSNKIISSTQTLQFEELKKDLKQLSLQIIELKAENTTLRSELNILKGKITSLEDAGSPSPAVLNLWYAYH